MLNLDNVWKFNQKKDPPDVLRDDLMNSSTIDFGPKGLVRNWFRVITFPIFDFLKLFSVIILTGWVQLTTRSLSVKPI